MTDKPRILFVDDEPDILQSLRLVLHGDRARWQLAFASSAKEALDELARSHYDVVVSDMRMPDMDGEQLLVRVQQEHPRAGRVLLTGYSDPEALQRVRPILHELLMKP